MACARFHNPAEIRRRLLLALAVPAEPAKRNESSGSGELVISRDKTALIEPLESRRLFSAFAPPVGTGWELRSTTISQGRRWIQFGRKRCSAGNPARRPATSRSTTD